MEKILSHDAGTDLRGIERSGSIPPIETVPSSEDMPKGISVVLNSQPRSANDGVQPELPLLTIIIPVYNEVRSIRTIVTRIRSVTYTKQIIVVDDGSTDGTAQEMARLEEPPHVEVLSHSRNRGKGAAIRTALEHAVARFTIIQDADLEYDPNDYPALITPLLTGEADVVYGSRYLNRANRFVGRRHFDAGVKLLNLAVRTIYGIKITDEATCYKVFPTAVLRAMNLQCERFEFCPEVTAKTCRLGLRLKEVPIQYTPRGISDGKKIRLKDGLEALSALWRFRNWQSQAAATSHDCSQQTVPDAS